MTKILVTGGAGYVGSVLLPFLLDAGHHITIYDLLRYGGSGIIPHITNKRLNFVCGDIRDKSTLEKEISQHDIVIHLAAIVGLQACKRDPLLAHSTNVEGTRNVSESMSLSQLLLFASSVSNYGAASGQACDEKSSLHPISCYGMTKTEAEKIVLDIPNSICFRFATAFGVSPRMRLDLLINDFVYQALVNKVLVLFEKKYKRTFAHVRDISRCLLFALENDQKLTDR